MAMDKIFKDAIDNTKDSAPFQNQVLAGADVNQLYSEDGQTVLMALASVGAFSKIRMALRAGAQVNAVDNDGFTALMYAAKEGNTRCVDVLLSASANPTLMNNEGLNASDLALRNGHARISSVIQHTAESFTDKAPAAEVKQPEPVQEPAQVSRPRLKF